MLSNVSTSSSKKYATVAKIKVISIISQITWAKSAIDLFKAIPESCDVKKVFPQSFTGSLVYIITPIMIILQFDGRV